MKIVYCASSALPSYAANGIHVMKMCQALAKNGHDVVLLYPDKKNHVEKDILDIFSYYNVEPCFEVKKLFWPNIPGKGYLYAFLAAYQAKKIKANIVFGRNLFGCLASAWFGLPVIFESHSVITDSGKSAQTAFEWLISSSNFKKFVCITHALKQHYILQYPQIADKTIVAADGADPVSDSVKPIDLNGSHRMQVGYVGSLYKGRGIDLIADLAILLSDIDFHIVGGQETDIATCKIMFSKSSNVTFHGHQTPKQVNGFLKAFDVLLAPYQKKVAVHSGKGDTGQWMSPLKIFEYMAAGKAIIASDLPVLREVLINDENAILVSPTNATAWKDTLEYLRDNPVKRNEMGQRAQKIFLQKYTWQARAAGIIEAYHG